MKKRIFLTLTLVAAILVLAVPPVFATKPTMGTFTQGIVQVSVSPPDKFTTGDIVHASGGTSNSYMYGAPWGNSISSVSTSITQQYSTVTHVGSTIGHTVDTYAAGVVEGRVNAKLLGLGSYTYTGSSFSFSVGGRTGQVVSGATYFGVLLSGNTVKHGISGELDGLVMHESATGVIIVAGPLAGLNLVASIVTYKLHE